MTELSVPAGPFLRHGLVTNQQGSVSGTAASEEPPHFGAAGSGMPDCIFTINPSAAVGADVCALAPTMPCILHVTALSERLHEPFLEKYCTHGFSIFGKAVSLLHFRAAGVKGKQLVQVAQEVYNEVAMLGLTLKTPLAHGILEIPAQNDHIYRMEVTMWFPQVRQLLQVVSSRML